MSPLEVAFLGLLGGGILALLGGLMLTRLHWRPDVPAYGRRTRLLAVAIHPEEYARDAPFRLIRSLNAGGAVLLGGAVFLVTYEVLRTSLGR